MKVNGIPPPPPPQETLALPSYKAQATARREGRQIHSFTKAN